MAKGSERYNEVHGAEEPARVLLERLGYEYVPAGLLAQERGGERDVLLFGRLRRALRRLNPWLSAEGVERAIYRLSHPDAVGLARNQRVHEYLTYGLPLEIVTPSGRQARTVRFFDFEHPEPRAGRNEFVVTTQFRVRRANERPTPEGAEPDDTRAVIPDLVLFVNGIPLVVIEAKSPMLIGDAWRTRAVDQLLRYQEALPEFRGRGAPELFDYALLAAGIAGPSGAVYGAPGAMEGEYAGWRPEAGDVPDAALRLDETDLKGQAALLVGLLPPVTLLDMLRDFVVYEPSAGRLVKKLPRHQQYRAVVKALARILSEHDPNRRGGVIWHTQGSGKSLTMLWLATKLRREPRLRQPTIVVVTDRRQLDDQISETFRRCGFPEPERAASTADLRTLLQLGGDRTISTTIQKFDEALTPADGPLRELNSAENVFVMVDEAHRTQYGLLAAKMRAALPNATFIGFTGTPIDKGFKRSTMGTFGDLIDKYTIVDAVDDGATVPIFYEARLPELEIQGPERLDQLFDTMFRDEPEEIKERIRRRFATKETLAEAERRIAMIADDIALHFDQHVRPDGWKAQVVAPSRLAAIAYADALNAAGVNAFPIITTTADDDRRYDAARSFDQKRVIEQFKQLDNREVELLVVVDMLLTGFDAPVEQVLYLDRGLREHTLLQAIARVNRRCRIVLRDTDGSITATDKNHGLIVDYWGVSRDLEAALADFDRVDVAESMLPLPDPAVSLDGAARTAMSYFKGLPDDDPWAWVRLFEGDASSDDDFKADLFEHFNRDYREFARLMDQYLPNAAANAYVETLRRLTWVWRQSRAIYLRENIAIDWRDVSRKVKQLIDKRVNANVLPLMAPVSILDQEFEARIAELPHDEARASAMEHALLAQIKERLLENPVFYTRLSEQLNQVIAEMRQHVIDAAESVRRLRTLLTGVRGLSARAAEHGLSEIAFALYELLERELAGTEDEAAARIRETAPAYRTSLDSEIKAIAQRLERVLADGRAIVDWQQKEEVLRLMRRDLKRELRELQQFDEAKLNELAARMVDVARGSGSGDG